MTEKPQEQGRVASMVNALKQLLSAPLIFIVAVGILLPLSAGIGANALAFEWENTIALVLVLSGVIILVVIPLMVIYTYRENQHELSSARLTAIESEAERRNEQERNKQKRFNELMTAKMSVLFAERDYILDQSERHERRLLKETSEALGEQMMKGIEFEEKAEKFDLSVTEVLGKLGKTEIKFDSILESLGKISRGLESDGAAEPSVSSDDDSRILPDYDYDKMLAEKDVIIANLEDLMKSSGDTVAELRKERDDLQFALEKHTLRKGDFVVTSQEGEMKGTITTSINSKSLKDALDVVEKMADKHDDPQSAPPEPLGLPQDDLDLPISAPTEYDNAVQEELAEVRPADPSPNYWSCPKCLRPNTMKRPRCQCGTSKPL